MYDKLENIKWTEPSSYNTGTMKYHSFYTAILIGMLRFWSSSWNINRSVFLDLCHSNSTLHQVKKPWRLQTLTKWISVMTFKTKYIACIGLNAFWHESHSTMEKTFKLKWTSRCPKECKEMEGNYSHPKKNISYFNTVYNKTAADDVKRC